MSWYLDNNDTLLLSSREVYGGRYYKADYIEFNVPEGGKACINTGITDDNTTSWDVNFEYVTLSANDYAAGLWDMSQSQNLRSLAGTADGSYWVAENIIYSIGYPRSGTNITATKQSSGSTYSVPYNILIGALNIANSSAPINPDNGVNAHFKVYYFDIKKNGTKVAEFFPAYDPVNEEWGMYDAIGNQFHGNAGAEGTYIYGGYYTPESEIVTLTPEVLAFDYDDPPASMWYLSHEEIIVNGLIPEPLIDNQGAFNKCTHLVEVEIPASVTSIGRYSFRETQLKKVKISSNCTYYDTSFPDDCVISFYPS